VRFLFWDLGGAAGLRVLWDRYFADAHAVVWIVDARSDAEPRARLQTECAREIARVALDKDLQGAPIIVLANKQDCPSALSAHEVALALGLPAGSAVGDGSGASSSAASSSSSSTAAAGPASTKATKRGAAASGLTPSAAGMAAAAAASAAANTDSPVLSATPAGLATPASVSPSGASSVSSALSPDGSGASAASVSSSASAAAALTLPAAALPSNASNAFDDHTVRVLGISALKGTGVRQAVDLLLELIPRQKRTQLILERG
jgi:hypothetical protein